MIWRELLKLPHGRLANPNLKVDLDPESEAYGQPVREPIGVIAHKEVIEALGAMQGEEAYAEFNKSYELITGNVGGVTGSNEFRECRVGYVVGLNFLRPDYMNETLHGYDEYEQRMKDGSDFEEDLFQYTNEAIDNMERPDPDDLYYGRLESSMIQHVGRFANRVMGAELGDGSSSCQESIVKICLPQKTNYKLTSRLITALEEGFTGVNIERPGWWLDQTKAEADKNQYAYAAKLKADKSIRSDEARVLMWFDKYGVKTGHRIADIVTEVFFWDKAKADKIRKRLKGTPSRPVSQPTMNLMDKINTIVMKKSNDWILIRVDKLP